MCANNNVNRARCFSTNIYDTHTQTKVNINRKELMTIFKKSQNFFLRCRLYLFLVGREKEMRSTLPSVILRKVSMSWILLS
jgi:hypothetical protein